MKASTTRPSSRAWPPPGILLLIALLCVTSPSRAGDPYVHWYTIKTPHFRVHFHGGLEAVAQRTATLAEAIQQRLVPDLGWTPTQVTEIVLTDDSESANGSAGANPYNAIHLFVAAPEDMSVLSDYDDWLVELLTHEDTHVLHIDNVSGLPALLNAVLGKTYTPNDNQPHWILEGLAVAMESRHTTAGRLRATQFDMFLRADVLEKNIASLDKISHSVRRWPSGNLWYLYGSSFTDWISRTYGPDTFAAVAADYGQFIIPFGINRSIRRATGRTYPELYRGWIAYLEKRYAAQVEAVRRRGLREGKRITFGGRVAAYPRFVPAQCAPGSASKILYFRDDGDRTAGLYQVALSGEQHGLELVTRTLGQNAAFDPECGLVFDHLAASRRRYFFNDLFRQLPGTRSPRGTEHNRVRLTTGRRAHSPDVSPDGRQVVYVTGRLGTTMLRIADLSPGFEITNERQLAASGRFEQVFTPRFSPDGRRVAYGVWTRGGYRDIRIVDTRTGRVTELMHDRALDQQPAWSPDGRYLFFTSDRTGIPNVYAYELEAHTLHQVTNVITGAYMPEVSPDGKWLVYVGYTAQGFDLYVTELDRRRFLPAEPYSEPRGTPVEDPVEKFWRIETYNPLSSLRPRAYNFSYGPGTFGDALVISTTGFDVVGYHAFAASLAVESELGEPQASLDYIYGRLPFDFRVSAFRSAAPRIAFKIGDQQSIVTEHALGVTTGIAYGIPGDFESQQVALSYTIVNFDQRLPVAKRADPFVPVTREPHHGYLGLVRVGYSYSNAEGSLWGISSEKGISVSAALDYAANETGSESTLTAVSAHATAYVLMPWAAHHVLAFGASGGAAVGTYPRRGLYYTGGFADLPLVDAFTSGIRQSSFVLRGYRPAQFVGTDYNLLNFEYRFPLAYPERGLSTLPIFLRTVSGAVFTDIGGAYDRIDQNRPFSVFHVGVGAELWLDVIFGYFVSGTVRLGLAHGLDKQAPGFRPYAAVSAAF